jgi:hypothetical protein
MTRYDTPRTAPAATGLEVNTAVVTPTDRIRWGPILAGVFAALTAAAVLSTLGAAIGMSAYDRNDSARSFAIGAGVWGAITMLAAFALGGWLAARSAAIRGRNNGLLNGVMVAGVGIPLLMFLIGSAGALMSHAELANGRDTQAEQRMTNSGPAAGFDGAAQAGASMRANGRDANASASGDVNSQDRAAQAERASDKGSRAAWSTLTALLMAIGASAVGGYLGAREDRHDHQHDHGRVATA